MTENKQQENQSDKRLNPEKFASQYDYIIVGAGSAGSVLAHRLIKGSDATVLVLEAGGSESGIPTISNPVRWPENIGSVNDWNYMYAPSPVINNRSILIARGKVLGGCGSINAMVWARGDRAIYDRWAAAGNTGWDYDSLLPLFKKTEDWQGGEDESRGSGGQMYIQEPTDLNIVATTFLKASEELGLPRLEDMNAGTTLGYCPLQVNIREGKRLTPAEAFIRPVLDHPNLTVLTGAQVQKLHFSGDRCTGLSFVHKAEQHEVFCSEEVVLTAGTIDTPKLLILSGIGAAEELAELGIEVVADLPGVGKNLHDHPVIGGLCFEANQPIDPINNNMADSGLFWKSDPDLEVADIMLAGVHIPYMTPEIQAQFTPPANTFTLFTTLVQVKSRGYVKVLSNSPDAPLEIQPNFLQHPADMEAMLRAMELSIELAEQPAFRKLIRGWVSPSARPDREGLLEFLRDACSTYYHPVGTCAMGSHPEAVVDSKLAVHGIKGLRIADASIMPESTSANTQAPAMLIAEFAAREILEQWNKK